MRKGGKSQSRLYGCRMKVKQSDTKTVRIEEKKMQMR